MGANARSRSTRIPYAAALIVLLVITLGHTAAPAEDQPCDPYMICGRGSNCIDGRLYASTCGPANCDKPLGECAKLTKSMKCDPRRECEWRWTCFDGLLYPTTCGPANCDAPLMKCQQPWEDWRKQLALEIHQRCENTARGSLSRVRCEARLHLEQLAPRCGHALTCIDGLMYASTCGPTNREQPIGKCGDLHWYCRRYWNTQEFFRRETAVTVTTCLKEGARPNARDKRGYTPLHWAARHNRDTAVTSVLIDAGADLNARSKDGTTPLDWARYNDPAIAALLEKAGARTGSRGSNP